MAGNTPKHRRVVRRVRGELRPQQGGKGAEARAQAAQQLLLAITRTQALFIDEAQPARLFGALLEDLLTLTNSEYGFIGEVERIAEGQPFLRIHAMTDIAWDEETKALMAQKATTLELSNLKPLFGHAMTTGQPVIVNDPVHDPRAVGLPPGYPPMHAFLGLPFVHGGVMTGMVGIANRPGGYDETLVAYLQPLLGTCGQLFEGFCNKRFRNEAEQALRVSEDRFRVAMQGANDGIWDWDLCTNQVYVSERWKNMLGYEDHEIADVSSEWESRLHPDDHARVLSGLTAYLQNRQDAYVMEFRLRKKDGTYCWIHARGKAMWDVEGRPYRMAGSHTDITERKREEALQVAEKQTLELVANGTSLGEVLAFLCRAIETHTALMLSSVMLATEDGSHLSAVAGPSLPDEYNQLINRISIGPTVGSCGSAAYFRQPAIVCDIATDPLWKGYADFALAHGLKACWSQPILSSTGLLLGTFATYFREPMKPQQRDLRLMERASHIAALAIEHARTLEALRESEERFRLMFMHEPECVKTVAPDGMLLAMNPTGLRMVEAASLEEVVGRSVMPLIHSDDRSVFWEAHCAAVNGSASALEFRVIGLKGQLRWMDTHSVPLREAGGTITAVLSVTRDITQRKALERASQDQADRLRLAMDIARLATWDWNILTNQVIWSENCEAVNGLPLGSLDGTVEAYQRFVHPEDLPRLFADIDGALSGQQPYHTEHRIVSPTGEVQWVAGNGVVYRDELGRPIRMVGTVRNITERKRIDQAMRVSEERYARATSVGRVGVWELDVQAGTYYGDRNLKAMFGYQPDELSADPFAWLNLVHPDDQSVAMDHWQQIVRREAEGYNYELRMIRKDGTVIWTNVRGQAVRTADGQLTHLIGATLDITARRQAEDNLLRTQFAMDHAVDAVYWIDPQARVLYTNAAASAMLGYTKEEFLRMTVHDLNPDFPAEVWSGWWEEMREKKVMSLETVHKTKDGRRIPIDICVSFLAYGGQEFHCAYVRDISERKRVHEALRASQERFELAAKASNDGIWDWNILTGEQYWSDRHLELFGLERSAFIPTYDAWIAQVHPDDADWVHQTTQRHLDTREPYDIEVRVKIKDGSYRWFRDRGQAVWDASGRPVRMVGSITDVTQRRQAEEAIWKAHAELEQRVTERTTQLAASNRALEQEILQRKQVEDRLQRTQYAVDHAADQIFVIESNGHLLDVNESACARLGYTKEKLLTMSMMDIDPDFPSMRWDEMWDTLRCAGQLLIETRHRSQSGEMYPVEVVANYLEHNGQELDYAIVRDLTERRRSEAAIRESELRYKLVTEATFDAIALHDNGILIEVNAGLERMFGYQSGELLGRSILDLIADESRDHVVRNMGDGMIGPYEALGRRKDGTTFAGEVVVRPYWFCGKYVRLVAGRDITARKQLETAMARHTEELERQVSERTAEIAKLEAQRAQSEKLAAVGQLAAAVAHEINNPIAGIRNAFILVKQAVDQAHPHYEFVGMIDREISRVADIVRNMYQLYRKQASKTEPVDLRLLLSDLKALFAKQLSQGDMTFVATLQCSMTTLQVPRGDLLQVLMNLIQNAIDSSDQGRTIGLTVCEEEGTVNISVSDEGGGIAPEVLPHIFDPFFTTKTEKYQKGMGLGLSVSQSLVMAMGGRIEVRTELKTGSTFSVVLPQTTPVDSSTAQQHHIIKEVLTHDY